MTSRMLPPNTSFRSPTSVPEMVDLNYEVFRFLLPFEWLIPRDMSIKRIFVEPDPRWAPMGAGEIPAPKTRQSRGMLRLSQRLYKQDNSIVDREIFEADALSLMDTTMGQIETPDDPAIPSLVSQLSSVLAQAESRDPGSAIAAVIDFVLTRQPRTGFHMDKASIQFEARDTMIGRLDMPLGPTWISFYALTKRSVR